MLCKICHGMVPGRATYEAVVAQILVKILQLTQKVDQGSNEPAHDRYGPYYLKGESIG